MPQDQAKRMVAAMKFLGRSPDVQYVKEGGHSFSNERGRIEVFNSIAAFLGKHLGPGVEFSPEP